MLFYIYYLITYLGFHHLQQLTPSSHVWVTVHDLRDVDIKDGVKVYSVVGDSMSQRITNSLVSFSNAVELSQNKPDCLRGKFNKFFDFLQL